MIPWLSSLHQQHHLRVGQALQSSVNPPTNHPPSIVSVLTPFAHLQSTEQYTRDCQFTWTRHVSSRHVVFLWRNPSTEGFACRTTLINFMEQQGREFIERIAQNFTSLLFCILLIKLFTAFKAKRRPHTHRTYAANHLLLFQCCSKFWPKGCL